MIAYNKIWLANLRVQAEIKKDKLKGYISDAEFTAIADQYPVGFYTPGLFVRLGMFILTCVIVSFADGLLTLIFASSGLSFTYGWMFFLGLLCYVALEVLIRTKHHFRSGVDDALLLICGCLFVTGFAIMLIRTDNDYVLLSLILFLLNLCFTARFADTLMSALCCMAFLAFVFFGWTNAVAWGMATIPFVMMLVSGGLYWICLTFLKQKKLADYQNCFITAQTIALLALYISGNFYVIQRLSVEMNGQNGSKIPFAAYFWIWTMAVPLIYVGLGIRHKNRILGRIGLLLIACAVETFRTYYHLFPLDIALAAGGH